MNYFIFTICFGWSFAVSFWDFKPKKKETKDESIFSSLFDNYYMIDNISNETNSLFISIKSNNTKVINRNYTLEINFISYDIIQFIFREVNSTAFELPKKEPFPFHRTKLKYFTRENLKYQIVIYYNPFCLEIRRRATNETIFMTSANLPFLIMDNFCLLSTMIPTEYLFGLGQRTSSFKIRSGIYTMYNKDNPSKLDFGVGTNNNKYGSHPMYLMKENSGNYFISYLRNSFPMDIKVKIEKKEIHYFISGGVLDFSLFLGDKNPETVIEKYHKYLGGWMMPPFWSLGLHQSRWGYKYLNMISYLLSQYDKSPIPLDALWIDIDYMNKSHPCTWNEKNFPSEKFKELFRKYKKKYVLLSEPVIGIQSKKLIDKGKNMSVFIRDSLDEDFILNKMWPGKSYFIDYFHPNASSFSSDCHEYLYNKSNYSGIWLDMNEIATFSNGQIDTSENELPCLDVTYPYYPGGYLFEHKTLCPNALHYNYTNIQIHNYYSLQQSMLVKKYLLNKFPSEYPFILSRGNAPGIGRYSFLWSGDNDSNYTWYHFSLSEVFTMNLFGVPMSGADVCGFAGETDSHMCSKWYQVGAFYPFFRAHRHHDYNNNDPFSMGNVLYETAKQAIQFRYRIVKYFYSLFIKKNHLGTIFRPVFFEFYNDNRTLSDYVIDNMFVLGNDLLCIPNMNYFNKSKTMAVFPEGYDWYELKNYTKQKKSGYDIINVQLKKILNVYLKGGSMIYMNSVKKVKSSFDLDNVFSFVISFKHYFDYIYVSYGEIPGISNYNDKENIEGCFRKNCFIPLHAIYDMKKNFISIHIRRAEIYSDDFTHLSIKSLKLLFPFSINEHMTIESNSLKIKRSKILSENAMKISLEQYISIESYKEYIFKLLYNTVY